MPGIRRLAGEDRYDERWLAGFRMLQDAGLRCGIVYVVTRHAIDRAHDVYMFFRNLDPGTGVRVNPVYAQGRAIWDSDGVDCRVSPTD